MTRRPALGPAAAALCALLALPACHPSPEAGHPNTTPTSSIETPPQTASSTPAWNAEEQAAVTAAKARYVAARAAIDKALNDPTKSSRAPLEAAGLGGSWIIAAIDDVRSLRQNGWYRSGSVQIRSLDAQAVNLGVAQPEVMLKSCIDSSATKLHFQKDDKIVPVGPGTGRRNAFTAKVVYAARTGTSTKMWFVIEEKAIGAC
ncbi:hypothetical protein [Kribbella swartbergensis]